MAYILAFSFTFAAMLVAVPQLIKLAHRTGFVEKPKQGVERKVHSEPKPYLASVGIFFAFWAAYCIFVRAFDLRTLLMFAASSLIFAVGIVDDKYKTSGGVIKSLPKMLADRDGDLKSWPKMLVQLAACVIIYCAGIRFNGFTGPFGGAYITLPYWLRFVLTVTWLFGVTTVINFSDGLDGLAGGISFISACTLFVIATMTGYAQSALMCVMLAGACLGYLKYNRHPSKILMGDSGATFLGFMLAVISLEGAFKQATVVSILAPVLALGVPIFDNIFVVFKRIKEKKPIYVGDTSQIHFRLLKTGLNQKQAVNFLYLVSVCFGLGAVILILI